MRILEKKKGDISIGMLIVQVASILFVMVFVYLFIQSSDADKITAKATEDAALSFSKTGFFIEDITAMSVDSNTTDAEAIITTVSPIAGSDPINLNNTLIYIQVGNRTAILHIRNGTTEKDEVSGFYTK